MTNELEPQIDKKDLHKDRPATITELLELAGKLYKDLIYLSKQEDPAALLEGVIKMPDEKDSVTLKASGRTYFMDVGKTKTGTPYLKLTESRIDIQTQKPVRNTIVIFEEQIKDFYLAFSRLVVKLKKP